MLFGFDVSRIMMDRQCSGGNWCELWYDSFHQHQGAGQWNMLDLRFARIWAAMVHMSWSHWHTWRLAYWPFSPAARHLYISWQTWCCATWSLMYGYIDIVVNKIINLIYSLGCCSLKLIVWVVQILPLADIWGLANSVTEFLASAFFVFCNTRYIPKLKFT